MKVLVIVACLAAAAVAQLQPAGYTAGPLFRYEKVAETSAQPEYRVQVQQPASLLVKSVEQQVPVTGFQQASYVSQQPASYFKTVEKIENPVLLNGEIQKYEKIEKIEGAQKVPVVTAYSGGYEQSAYIQKQPAFASLSGYKTQVAQPALTTYTKEVVSAPAVTSYISKPAVATFEKQFVSSTPAPVISTYTAYKQQQQTPFVAQPAVATYQKSFIAPAVSTFSYSQQPAVSAYKKEFVAPAVSSYSAFPAASTYKQESFIAAKPALTTYKKEFVAPAVSSYSAFPAASTYKQESFIAAKPALTTYKKEFVAPAVSSYSAFPAASTYKQESFISAKPVVSTYKKEFVAPAVSSYSAFPAASTYKQESFIAAQPAVSAYGAAFQKDSHLYSQSSAKYGGSAMFPGSYQSAEGASSILKFYNDDDGTGIYQYGYATSNGINHDEQGKVLASGSKSAEGSSTVSGSYSYLGPDGVTYTVKYTADEQGFRAYGDHLPKLSEEAQRAIDESAKYGEQKDY